MKLSKRFLCAALALVLCFGLVAVGFTTANAAEAGTQYKLVTDVNELTDGAKVIFVSGTAAMGAQNTGNYRDKVAITAAAENIITITNEAVDVVTVGNTGSNYTFAVTGGSLYYDKATGTSKNNNVFTGTVAEENATTAQWTISITDGVATITNVYNNERYLQYNGSSSRFACYLSTSNQKDFSIYKLVESGSTEPDPQPSEKLDENGQYISIGSSSVVFDAQTHFRYYLTSTSGTTFTNANCGMEYWTSDPGAEPTNGNKIEGCLFNNENNAYVCTGGIPAALVNNAQYYRAYVTIGNVTYYTPVQEFSLAIYEQKLTEANKLDDKLAAVLDALQAYGAAAAAYFG